MPQTPEERRAKKVEANRRWRQANPDKHRAACKRWEDANPDKTRARSRRAMAKRRVEQPAEYFYRSLKARAQDGRGEPKEFDLTVGFLEELLRPMRCSKTGVKLIHSPEGPSNRLSSNPWAPSIDRVDSTRGYTQDNVQLVCWAFNMAKGPWSEEVFQTIATGYLEANRGS